MENITQPTSDFLDATLERVLRQSEQHRAQWNVWASDKPQSLVCQAHQQVRPIDGDRSLQESWAQRRNVVVYRPCHLCLAAAQMASWLLARGVPENLLHASFENYAPKTSTQERALDLVGRFAKQARGFLLLTGATKGVGKSHLAVSVMRSLRAGRFRTHDDLMNAVSRRYDDRSAEDPRVTAVRTKLLVLDDLGISRGGSDELPILHNIMESRYGARLPTVITSNLSLREVQEYLGGRIADRMTEACFAACELTGESFRVQRRKGYFDD